MLLNDEISKRGGTIDLSEKRQMKWPVVTISSGNLGHVPILTFFAAQTGISAEICAAGFHWGSPFGCLPKNKK